MFRYRDWWTGERWLYNAWFRTSLLAITRFQWPVSRYKTGWRGNFFFWSNTIFITRFSIRRGPTRRQILRNSRTDCCWFYCVPRNGMNRKKVSYVIQMVWRNRFHRKWVITVAHSPLTGIWYSSNTCTMKGLIEVSPEKCTKKKNGITSMSGRRVGGRSRSRIRSNISTCFPQHVLPPTGAWVSETIEFVNYFKPEVQVSLWLTVSQYVCLGVEPPLGLKTRFFVSEGRPGAN